MEIKRYSSIYFLIREMKKDLFGVDVNNPTDETSLLFSQLINLDFFHQSVKKSISINGKKIN